MSMIAAKSRISTLTKMLANDWNNTKEQWNDKQSAHFQQQYMEGLLQNVTSTVEIIEKLDKLVTKVKRDCE